MSAKYTTAAISRNLISAEITRPHDRMIAGWSASCAARSTTPALARSPALKISEMSGLKMPSTRPDTIAVKAPPITTATARSMTLPRRMNSRKPFSMTYSFFAGVLLLGVEPDVVEGVDGVEAGVDEPDELDELLSDPPLLSLFCGARESVR